MKLVHILLWNVTECDLLVAVLQKAGRHMEHTLIAAYVAILLGYLTLDNQVNKLLYKLD